MWLQMRPPLCRILFSSWFLEWICNDCAGCWIKDRSRQVFKPAEMSESNNNAGCRDGYNVTCLVFSSSWSAMTACTQCGSWSTYLASLCSRRVGSHALIDICNARIVRPG